MNKATTTTGGIWLALGSMRRSERKGLFRMAMGTVRAKLIRLPGLLAGVWMSWAAMGETRPNLLFVFSDDQSFDTIRATGNREVSTPNLDRLVSEGTLFTHAYNMGSWSGAVCIPSRTMLNTGRFLWPTRRLHQDMAPELEAGRFWAQRLQRVGYRTYFTGKWHVSADVNRIFGVTGTVRGGMPRDTPEGYNRPRTDQPDPWSPWDPRFGGFWEGGRHWSEVVGDDALRFLGVAQEESEPFFMYIAFNAPHDPRQSPQEFVERYPVDEIRVPANYLPEYPYAEAIGCGPGLRDERLAPFPRSEHAVRVHRQEYYAIITHMDAQVGRILDEVERAGLGGNTWIFFTSDHGLAVGQHGLMGKQNLYDHSVRVPLVVVGPGVPRGRRIEAPVYLQDIMPTTLELAGADSSGVDFHSLLPLLREQTRRSAYPAIYGAYLDLQRAVTADHHKLILYPGIRRARLFDLANDPREMTDLANDPAQQPLMRRLFGRLRELQKQMGDELDCAAAFPEFH